MHTLVKFVSYILPFTFSFVLAGRVISNSTESSNYNCITKVKTEQLQSQLAKSGQNFSIDTLKLDELSNTKNLIGYWLMPHNAGINLEFHENGTFVFNDYNTKLNRPEQLHGKYLLQKGQLRLIYGDRPKQVFKFYKDGDLFYIRKGTYYFVQGEKI